MLNKLDTKTINHEEIKNRVEKFTTIYRDRASNILNYITELGFDKLPNFLYEFGCDISDIRSFTDIYIKDDLYYVGYRTGVEGYIYEDEFKIPCIVIDNEYTDEEMIKFVNEIIFVAVHDYFNDLILFTNKPGDDVRGMGLKIIDVYKYIL